MTTLSLDDVLFSWALAEAYSPRWRDTMQQGLSQGLLQKLKEGAVAFTPAEKQELLEPLKEHRKDKIKGYIAPFTAFQLGTISLPELEALPVSPQISGWDRIVTLGQFIDGKYSPDTFSDPRNAAKRMLASPENISYQGYPIVSFSKKLNCPILIEGYTRCIVAVMRHRKAETLPPLQVIFCKN